MKKNKIIGLDLDIFEEELNNGLKIYLVPMNNVNDYKVTYTTKYGSIDTKYYKHNKLVTNPSGVAHFLEHKLFEQEDEEDVHAHFEKNSTYNNAFTSYTQTTYYCEGNKAFEDDLSFLIEFVNSPYFTEDNIKKEQGIIAEEINTRNDNYYIKLIEESKKGLFHHKCYKEQIAGTIDSISKITPKILYDCYNTFYVPNNMYIVVTGNFDKDKALEIINNKFSSITRSEEIKREIPEEQEEVYKKKEIIKENVETSKFIYSIKIDISKNKKYNKIEKDLFLDLLTDTLLSNSSDFYIDNFENNNFTTLDTYVEGINNLYVINIAVQTDKINHMIDEIKRTMNLIPDEKTFERKKKVLIANIISSSSQETYISYLINTQIKYFDKPIYDYIDIIRSLKYKDFVSFIKRINLNNTNITIIEKE